MTPRADESYINTKSEKKITGDEETKINVHETRVRSEVCAVPDRPDRLVKLENAHDEKKKNGVGERRKKFINTRNPVENDHSSGSASSCTNPLKISLQSSFSLSSVLGPSSRPNGLVGVTFF